MTKKREYRSLRNAFGQFATGVTVVTARNVRDSPIGLTANSFASVSLEPPLVSWCVDKQSARYQDLIAAEYFTISVLSAAQQDISDLFALRSWDNTAFDELDWFAGPNRVPQFPHVGARFHCKTEYRYAGGDHIIVVGLVEDFESEPLPPLLFFQGDYTMLG